MSLTPPVPISGSNGYNGILFFLTSPREAGGNFSPGEGLPASGLMDRTDPYTLSIFL